MTDELRKHQIKQVQQKLNCPATGKLDMLTLAAIHNFQLRTPEAKHIKTWQELYECIIPKEDHITSIHEDERFNLNVDSDYDADLTPSQVLSVDIEKYMLPEYAYVTDLRTMPQKRDWIFLHHTAGWDNPYQTVDFWKNDSRGRIGTHFVIGGNNIRSNRPDLNQSPHNGRILQCIPDEYFAWHLGIGNTKMHRESIGIELCNFGYLEKRNNGYYTIYGHRVDDSQVIELDVPFRGQKYWHRYSETQIESLYKLIKYCEHHFGVDVKRGIPGLLNGTEIIFPSAVIHNNQYFDYNENIRNGQRPGIFSHTNVIQSGKWDVSPQPLLIEMLKSL